MDLALRVSIRKLLVISLVILSLGIGYAVHNVSDASRSGSPQRAPLVTKKFSPSQLLLAAASATGFHMRMSGITTTTGPDHTNDIQIQDFLFGADLPVTTQIGSRTLGKIAVPELIVKKSTDQYSAPLLNRLLHPSSAPPATASLFFTNLSGPGATAFDYLTITMTGVFVSKYTLSPGDQFPFEEVRLNFAAMTFTYKISGGATTTVAYNIVNGT